MERKTDLKHNKIHHLEDTVIMYGVYNSDTLTELIQCIECRIPLCGKKEPLQEGTSMVSTIFASRRCTSLCHKFSTLSVLRKREIHENV